jgi:hypothetical protein
MAEIFYGLVCPILSNEFLWSQVHSWAQ